MNDPLGLYSYLIKALHCVGAEERARSHWVMDAEWLQDIMRLADDRGVPLWTPTWNLGAPDLLFGKPIEIRKGGGAPHLELA